MSLAQLLLSCLAGDRLLPDAHDRAISTEALPGLFLTDLLRGCSNQAGPP